MEWHPHHLLLFMLSLCRTIAAYSFQSNPHLATEMDWLALLHLQQIKTDSYNRNTAPPPHPPHSTTPLPHVRQRRHCVTKTGTMAHVDNGMYIISERCKGRALMEGGHVSVIAGGNRQALNPHRFTAGTLIPVRTIDLIPPVLGNASLLEARVIT